MPTHSHDSAMFPPPVTANASLFLVFNAIAIIAISYYVHLFLLLITAAAAAAAAVAAVEDPPQNAGSL